MLRSLLCADERGHGVEVEDMPAGKGIQEMPKTVKKTAKRDSAMAPVPQKPRSLAVAARGVTTGNDMAQLMSALMSDLIEGRISPAVGNATCNASGKLLKVVEMQYKYGVQAPVDQTPSKPMPTLVLAKGA